MKTALETKVGKKEKVKRKRGIFITIKMQLISICVIFAIIPLFCVSIVSTTQSQKALSETTKQLSSQLVGQVGTNLNAILKSNEANIGQIVVSDFMQSKLLSKYNSEKILEKQNALAAIQEKIMFRETLNLEYKNIYLLLENDELIGSKGMVTDKDFIVAREYCVDDQIVWQNDVGNEKGIFILKEMKYTIDSKNESRGAKAIAIIEFDEKQMGSILDEVQLLNDSQIYLVNQNGDAIYGDVKDNNKLIAKEAKVTSFNRDRMLISFVELSNGWKFIGQIPEHSLTDKLKAGIMMTGILVVVFMLLAVMAGLLVAKKFSSPIMQLKKLMKQAEEGDLTVQCNVKSNNEFGQLMRSFNHMIINIKKILLDTRQVISETVKDSKVMNTSTLELVEGFSGLAMSVGEIAKGANSQSEDTETCTEAMLQLSRSIEHVIRKTDVIFQTNQGAKELILDSNKSMEQLTEAMNSSAVITKDIKVSMLELNALNQNIGNMVSLLDGISGQTNLLSLNASIEAARAGDAGRGFAVVATEVRNLSEQSKESTTSVRKSLEEIEGKTNKTTELILKSNDIFSNQETTVRRAYNLFTKVIEALMEMDVELNDIKVLIEDMKVLKQDTSMQISNIAAVSEESVVVADAVSELSDNQKNNVDHLVDISTQLRHNMGMLSQSIELFKIDGNQ